MNPQDAIQFLEQVRRTVTLTGETHDRFRLAIYSLNEEINKQNTPSAPDPEYDPNSIN